MSQVSLAEPAREAVLSQAAGTYPFEACGLLIGQVGPQGVRILRAVPCPNVAERGAQTHRFEIDPRIVLDVGRSLRGTGESIVGFYHSHPDAAAVPSPTDLEYLRLWPQTVWLIVPVAAGEPRTPRAWWLDQAEAPAARELILRTLSPVACVACPE